MKSTMHKLSRLILAVLAAYALSPAPAAQSGAKYTVFPVGVFGALERSVAIDLNNLNEVVGYYLPASGDHRAFRYSGGTNVDLGTLGGRYTAAQAINDAGVITGFSAYQAGTMAPYHATRYAAGTMTDLGTLGGSSSIGTAVNNAGYIVGPSMTSSNNWDGAFIWNGSTMTSLATAGWSGPHPNAINAANTIVGSGIIQGTRHAFTYTAGVITDLGTLPGDSQSAAFGVNDAGVVVGWSRYSDTTPTTAVQWSSGAISALPNLAGAISAVAYGINAGGEIVGVTSSANGLGRAVRWSGGTIVDLNTEIPAGSGWTLEDAYAINDSGAIVGYGYYNGITRGFLLVPVADTTPPAISCGTADGMWHAANVSIACTASDSGSGLADPADASFSLSTSVAAGTEDPNAFTGTRTVCDNAANCAIAGPIGGNKIDRAAPAISINAPTAATYRFLSSQIAWYGCADGGSGVAACNGTVPGGAAIDTVTLGSHTFAVTASDAVGNTSAATVQYWVVATNWPQFHNGADRSGVQPLESVLDPTNVGSLGLDWASPTWYPIYASPVVVDGVVYIPSSDGQLRAFSAAYGGQLWAVPIGSYLTSTPAVADGRVFIGSDNGSVYAIDAASGGVLWQFATNGPVYASPAVAGGLVYVGSWDAHLYALDALTGNLVWRSNVVYPVHGDAAVANGTVYLANDALYAFDGSTGKQIWVAFPWWSSGVGAWRAAVFKDLVVVGADDGSVYAIDAKSAAVIWSAMTTYGTGGISGTPAIDRRLRLVYVGATDGSLYAFDLASGAQLWSSSLGGWVNSAAAANGVVYAGALGALHAVDGRTGAILWTATFGGAVSSPAVADGTVYVGNTDTYLYAFRR